MTPPASRRTILFVDVVASTELYEDLGDADARARMAPCLEALRGVIASHGGTVVKDLGDGILAAFDGERAAVDAALGMPASAQSCGLEVRVGVHAGDVIVEPGDVFGQAVNTASRLSAMAQPSEILVSRGVIDELPPPLQASARRLQDVAIKGLREPLELFALGHGGPAATMTFATKQARPPLGLELRLGERSWRVDTGSTVRLGREPSNDVVVAGDRVSRKHALVASRRGKYVLVDQSVNGTWLVPAGAAQVHLLREEATLVGSGEIVLGVTPDDPLAVPISYRILT